MTMVFNSEKSKEEYSAQARGSEYEQRYKRLLELLEDEPQWYDADLVYAVW